MKIFLNFQNWLATLSLVWSPNKILLVLLNVCIGSILILRAFMGGSTIDLVDFLFFSFVGLLVTLYRPGWVFLILIGMLPYENITIAPESFGFFLRPYQWLLVLLFLALAIRLLFRRFPFASLVLTRWDTLLIVLGVSAFFSALLSTHPAVALKQSVILSTFIILFFVCRLFIRSIDDVRMVFPFLFSSFLVIACYTVAQNILFLSGQESLEVMIGRPNATFTEADWLGGYLAVIIVTLSALIVSPSLVVRYVTLHKARIFFSILLFFGFVALIITVSRSAWLATLAGSILALGMFAWQKDMFTVFNVWNIRTLKKASVVTLFSAIPLLMALLLIYSTGLTPFDLLDRGKSLTSGEQKITVACQQESNLPDRIQDVTDLAEYGCEHITLEERVQKQKDGAYITEIPRTDPNINIRQNIYYKTLALLKEQWFFGVGFGVIATFLGTDGRGAGLNASNIFLEIWLGAGIIGFLAFLIFWFGLGWQWFFRGITERSSLALILSAVWLCVTVFNLFNSGLLLGWFFLFLACLIIDDQKT